MELNTKKKLHALSLAEKIQVLELLDESKMSQSEVARRFQVSQPQISRICKNKEKLLADWCSGTANRAAAGEIVIRTHYVKEILFR